jgi:hypothetical protein
VERWKRSSFVSVSGAQEYQILHTCTYTVKEQAMGLRMKARPRGTRVKSKSEGLDPSAVWAACSRLLGSPEFSWGDRLCRSLASTYPASTQRSIPSSILSFSSHLAPGTARHLILSATTRLLGPRAKACKNTPSPALLSMPSAPTCPRFLPSVPVQTLLPAPASRAPAISTKHSHVAKAVITDQQAAAHRASIAR